MTPGYPEYTRYYQAQALFQGDLTSWEKWNKLLIRQLKAAQLSDGSFRGPVFRKPRSTRPCLFWPCRSITDSFRSTNGKAKPHESALAPQSGFSPDAHGALVPTLCVGMQSSTLRVVRACHGRGTQSVSGDGILTQSVGTRCPLYKELEKRSSHRERGPIASMAHRADVVRCSCRCRPGGQLIQIRAVGGRTRHLLEIFPAVQPTVPKPVSHPVGPLLSLDRRQLGHGKLLEDTSSPDLIRWQSRPFAVAPLEFVTENVLGSAGRPRKKPVKGSGDYCFELSGGDVLFGSLVAFNEKEATVQTQGLGEVCVRASILRRIYRCMRDGADLVYPRGPDVWPSMGSGDRQPSEVPSPSGCARRRGRSVLRHPRVILTYGCRPSPALVEIEMS